jgi:putative drug exporter of the RND superfamily
MQLARSLLTLPAGRVAKWVVLAAWVAVAGLVAPFAGQLQSVQENEAASFLPSSAESTKALELQRQLPGGDRLPVVVVYRRDSGITPADRQLAAGHQRELARGQEGPPPVPSEDGKALLLVLSLPAAGADAVIDEVEGIRETVGRGEGDLQIRVTGPGGFLADAVSVFEDIDTTLLLVTVVVVAVLLLCTYRSPLLWLIPLLTVGLANQLATASVYGLVKGSGLTVDGQSAGILTVLVFGAGTDYALLLIARYREELRRHPDKHEAMAVALVNAGPAILASAATVIISLLCLLAADLANYRSLGPVGAVGIACALVAMLTLLPAVLVIFGRRLFWPFVPSFGSTVREDAGVWARVGRWVGRRPRPVWLGTTAILAVLALGLLTLDTNLRQEDQFPGEPDAVAGQRLIEASYPSGTGQQTTVIAAAGQAEQVLAAAAGTEGVAAVVPAARSADLVQLQATLDAAPDSEEERATIDRLRDRVHAVEGAGAVVGGQSAQSLDLARASARDRNVVIPLVLLVVLVILGVLLRAVVAPLVLIATVIVSFAAALGASAFAFDRILGFEGADPSLALLAFIFLVALGIDYNIFLMSRVREESERLGTREGTLRGLAVTGGVITSAGIVLAATFSVLAVLPFVPLIELGIVVAFGVLLDTLVVRSILVPALTLDIGPRIWWPSSLAGARQPSAEDVLDDSSIRARSRSSSD